MGTHITFDSPIIQDLVDSPPDDPNIIESDEGILPFI